MSTGTLPGRIEAWRARTEGDARHGSRMAAWLGIAVGVGFTVCFLTGLYSHLLQHPPGWWPWPARPAGWYRVTQGVHVATGIATIPLLFGKLWAVYPHLFRRPVVRDVAHAVERAALVPLVGGSIFLVVTGVANIDLWYPWPFFFPVGHHAVAWVTIGALVVHIAAKWGATRAALGHQQGPEATADGSTTRRRFLGVLAGTSALLTLVTVGQTVAPLRRLALLAPRRPDIGDAGFPVNRTAAEAGVVAVSDADARLELRRGVQVVAIFTLADLTGLQARQATLPIACVEGWSTSRRWEGVAVRDVLAAAGLAPTHVEVVSREAEGRYRRSTLDGPLLSDPDTLLAWRRRRRSAHPRPRRATTPHRSQSTGGAANEVGRRAGGLVSAPSRAFWPAVAVGCGFGAVGAAVALGAPAGDGRPIGIAAVVAGAVVVHDLVVAPVTHRVGAAISRRCGPGGAALRAAVAVSAVVVIFGLPLVTRVGARPTNSSALPLSYGRSVVAILAAVWLFTGGVLVVRRWRR